MSLKFAALGSLAFFSATATPARAGQPVENWSGNDPREPYARGQRSAAQAMRQGLFFFEDSLSTTTRATDLSQ